MACKHKTNPTCRRGTTDPVTWGKKTQNNQKTNNALLLYYPNNDLCVPGEFALSVRASPWMSVFLQRPDVREPECHRPLHYITLCTRRLTLPAVVTLPIEASIIPCKHTQGTDQSHTASINHCDETHATSLRSFGAKS